MQLLSIRKGSSCYIAQLAVYMLYAVKNNGIQLFRIDVSFCIQDRFCCTDINDFANDKCHPR